MSSQYADKKILVVDDVQDIRAMLQLVCEGIGCQVDTAENGQKAFRAITRNSYDLILLDIMMPEWDGVSTIKGLDFYKLNPKIIVISGFVSDELREDLKELNVVKEFVHKPFEISAMRELILKTLDSDD